MNENLKAYINWNKTDIKPFRVDYQVLTKFKGSFFSAYTIKLFTNWE